MPTASPEKEVRKRPIGGMGGSSLLPRKEAVVYIGIGTIVLILILILLIAFVF
jgi:hypothetical protein